MALKAIASSLEYPGLLKRAVHGGREHAAAAYFCEFEELAKQW